MTRLGDSHLLAIAAAKLTPSSVGPRRLLRPGHERWARRELGKPRIEKVARRKVPLGNTSRRPADRAKTDALIPASWLAHERSTSPADETRARYPLRPVVDRETWRSYQRGSAAASEIARVYQMWREVIARLARLQRLEERRAAR